MTLSTTASFQSCAGDAELVARSLQGDSGAYGKIVERYQSAICALTYASCGDVHQSEDLAQETFLAGWKNLRQLKEPALLRPWLRGIARNIVHGAVRKEGRLPPTQGQIENDLRSELPTPAEDAITNEEQMLLWQNLARLPEEYREALVLYYREQQSAAAVAEALGISNEAARQRLSRGRAMLAERIEKLIDRGLRHSAPGNAFSLGVVAALPGMALSHATTSLGATAVAKGGASAKVTASIAAAAGAILGPLMGAAGMYLGYRVGLAQTISPEERRFMRRFFRGIGLLAVTFAAAICAAVYLGRGFGFSPGATTRLLAAMSLLYVAGILLSCLWYAKRIRALRAKVTAGRPDMLELANRSARQWKMQYRSRWNLLGLPLIDVRIGGTADLRMPVARGWIAIGAVAYSPFIAIGSIALAPISWGGFSVGILTYGGSAIGIWSVGVFAIGWKSVGVVAIAWHGAQGIIVIACHYASGVAAIARHANDAQAEGVFGSEFFFRAWASFADHGNWFWAIALIPVAIMVRRARKIRRDNSLKE